MGTAEHRAGFDAGDQRVCQSPHYERLMPMIIERIDLMAAISVPREELPAQVTDIIKELVLEEQLSLNANEQDLLVNDIVSRVRRAADRLAIDETKGADART